MDKNREATTGFRVYSGFRVLGFLEGRATLQ